LFGQLFGPEPLEQLEPLEPLEQLEQLFGPFVEEAVMVY
jgi:hypothetical protein